MPVLYVNLNKHESLKKEPYNSFLKKFNLIRENLNGEQIEIRVGGKDRSFANGFYLDEEFYINPRLRVDFASMPVAAGEKPSMFIRVCYSYEGEDGYDLELHFQRVKDIKQRAEYLYIPGATHFEFSSQIDDEYKLMFDALVDDMSKIPDVCCLLISHIIAIFCLEN